MKLSDKQHIFAVNVAKLILWAADHGYNVTFREAFRPAELSLLYAQQGRGISNSLHTKRLAIDLNVFINGVYLEDTSLLKGLGEYWITLHPDNRWGGHFVSLPDGNHFSMHLEGVS